MMTSPQIQIKGSLFGQIGMGERAAWGGFPSIVRNGELGSLSMEPEYHLAKCGDKVAALELVSRLMTAEVISQVKSLFSSCNVHLLPVLAVEQSGNNKIPLAMAAVLSDRLNLDVELGIVQRETIKRTGAGSDHRLAFNPTFTGNVLPEQKYLVLDDTLTMGGTVASLRGYIENRGGHVIGASVMAAHEGALHIPVKAEMLAGIHRKHGLAMDTYWKETFGYGIEFLTQGEAGHLKAAPSVDAIRTRIATARHADIKQLDEI